LTAAAFTLVAVAGALDASRKAYPFWTGAPILAAYPVGAAAVVCFIAAIRVSSGTEKCTTFRRRKVHH
jgi:hypothetical protein